MPPPLQFRAVPPQMSPPVSPPDEQQRTRWRTRVDTQPASAAPSRAEAITGGASEPMGMLPERARSS